MSGLDLQLKGGAQLLELSKHIRAVGNRGLGQRMDKGLRRAAQPIGDAVKAEIAATMPKRGGYAALLAAAAKSRLRSRSSRYVARVSVAVDAKGKSELRDLPRINKGELRHPVHGRYRRVRGRGKVARPWVRQRVRAGVVDRPFEATAPRAQAEMLEVLDAVAAELAKG